MLVANEYHLKAGPLSAEGYFMFSNVINKPWGKFASYGLGVLLAFAYMDILSYRKIDSDNVRKECYPIIHTLHTKAWISYICALICLPLIPFTLLISYDGNKDPY
jgi:hypothetical protein